MSTRMVNVNLNEKMIKALDSIANKVGVPRSSIIKNYLYLGLKNEKQIQEVE